VCSGLRSGLCQHSWVGIGQGSSSDSFKKSVPHVNWAFTHGFDDQAGIWKTGEEARTYWIVGGEMKSGGDSQCCWPCVEEAIYGIGN
jgi:hypothetical protein